MNMSTSDKTELTAILQSIKQDRNFRVHCSDDLVAMVDDALDPAPKPPLPEVEWGTCKYKGSPEVERATRIYIYIRIGGVLAGIFRLDGSLTNNNWELFDDFQPAEEQASEAWVIARGNGDLMEHATLFGCDWCWSADRGNAIIFADYRSADAVAKAVFPGSGRVNRITPRFKALAEKGGA